MSRDPKETEPFIPFSDEELAELDLRFPALKAMDSVTDEEWVEALRLIQEMNQDGFPERF